MKKFFCSCAAALLTTATSYAQIAAVPNGNLEIWTGTGSRQRPQGWIVTDDLLASGGFPLSLNNVTRNSSAHGGSYAAQLSTASLLGGALPGALFLGSAAAINPDADLPGGIAYTSRPGRMEFYYKLTGASAATDSALAGVVLTRWVNGAREYIAEGNMLFRAAAATYTLASLPLQYSTNATPDTLHIFFTSGGQNGTAGTTLTIDDVALLGTPAATRDAQADAAFTVYPTRSADGRFTLSAATQPALPQQRPHCNRCHRPGSATPKPPPPAVPPAR